jgi:hypothetical protein
VTLVFCKLRPSFSLSQHSEEVSGIDGHGKESGKGRKSILRGLVQLVNACLSHRRPRVRVPSLPPRSLESKAQNLVF